MACTVTNLQWVFFGASLVHTLCMSADEFPIQRKTVINAWTVITVIIVHEPEHNLIFNHKNVFKYNRWKEIFKCTTYNWQKLKKTAFGTTSNPTKTKLILRVLTQKILSFKCSLGWRNRKMNAKGMWKYTLKIVHWNMLAKERVIVQNPPLPKGEYFIIKNLFVKVVRLKILNILSTCRYVRNLIKCRRLGHQFLIYYFKIRQNCHIF